MNSSDQTFFEAANLTVALFLDYNEFRYTRVGSTVTLAKAESRIVSVQNKSGYAILLGVTLNGVIIVQSMLAIDGASVAFNALHPTQTWVGVGARDVNRGIGPILVDYAVD